MDVSGASWLLGFVWLERHLKASKSLLNPSLITLTAFKPSLQNCQATETKPLALVGLWVLPVGMVGTWLSSVSGRGEQAASRCQHLWRELKGQCPCANKNSLFPHLMAQGILLSTGAPKQPRCLMGWSWGSLCRSLQTPQRCREKHWGYPGARPAALGSQIERLSTEITHPSGLLSRALLLASVKLIGFEVPGTNEGEKPTLRCAGSLNALW